MFSGIVERMAEVVDIRTDRQNKDFTLRADFCRELKIDQSIAHNGVCLTVVDIRDDTYTVTAMKETLDRSNLGLLAVGDLVNLERSMKPDALLDGHIVQGHVDQTAVCTAREDADGSWYYTFAYEPQGGGLCTVEKGSVTVNGVSLTVCDSKESSFRVAIIPLYVRAYELLPHRRGFGREPRIRHRGQVHRPSHAKLYEVSLMVYIKTKEGASLWIALLATAIVAGTMTLLDAVWWVTLCVCGAVFVVVALVALFIIRKYVAYKLKPIYSIVLSRDVHTHEIFSELKDKHVENIGEELTAWADTNDKEIARLKETEQFRKQYLGNVAHELKTPIFNIQGYISTLLDGGLEDELINRKYLERAEKSIDRLINIVNDLDTISKLESNMNRLEMEKFDIVALTKEIAEQAEMEADKKGIRISIKGADNLPSPFWVLADKHYIGQVIVNLVINSIRYGKEGGLTRVHFRDMLDKILVEVEDNGLGISKEDLPRVFERFYRTDKGRSREQGGTGLGLAIVKHIIEAHGERISVRSEPGVGSTFSFTLKKVNLQELNK